MFTAQNFGNAVYINKKYNYAKLNLFIIMDVFVEYNKNLWVIKLLIFSFKT